MEDMKARYKSMELEVEKIEQRRAAIFKRITNGTKKAQAVVDYAERELKRAMSEPSPEMREHLVRLNELRRQGALANMEMLQLLSGADMAKALAPATLKRIDDLCLRTQYIAMEFNLTNYKRVTTALEQALGLAPEMATAPAGRPGTGNLGAPGMPPRPGVPPRPGLPPRPAGAVGGTAPLPPRPLPPRPPAPTAPGARPGLAGPRPPQQPGGTGPLQARVAGGSGRIGSTAPLNRQAAAAANTAKLLDAFKAAMATEGNREKLQTLYDRVNELETSLAPLRGDLPGETAAPIGDIAGPIRQIAGKVYFINRAIANLGDLGSQLPFEGTDYDPQLMEILGSISPDEPAAPAAPAAADPTGSIAGRLKALFKA